MEICVVSASVICQSLGFLARIWIRNGHEALHSHKNRKEWHDTWKLEAGAGKHRRVLSLGGPLQGEILGRPMVNALIAFAFCCA